MGKISITACKCERCGHIWVPRKTTTKPRVCPHCKSPYWDIPKGEGRPKRIRSPSRPRGSEELD